MSETEANVPPTQEVEKEAEKATENGPEQKDEEMANGSETATTSETKEEEKNENQDPSSSHAKELSQQEKQAKREADNQKVLNAKSIYDFSALDIDGNEVSLSTYQGHPTIFVNVASKCGFTKNNYTQLNELYDKYEGQGLRIAAFPCAQFMNQEPGCDIDIKEFAKKNNVKFDMYSKVNVNGDDAALVWKYLKSKQGGFLGSMIKWNFTKFLVDKEGIPIRRYAPTTSPNSIEPDIKALLEPQEKA